MPREFLTDHHGLLAYWRDGQPVDVTPLPPVSAAIKRGADLLIASVLLVLLAPLMLAVAVAIRFGDGGPVLFRQLRVGQGGKTFMLRKFRSIAVDRCDGAGLDQVRPGDDRVTPVGRLLRATSLDELPQLFNVLDGTMALVGPRPHVPDMRAAGCLYQQLVPYYDLRHVAKPGITGWAQANGLRGPTTCPDRARARIEHDIAYIQNYSFWLDIRTLGRTLCNEIAGGLRRRREISWQSRAETIRKRPEAG